MGIVMYALLYKRHPFYNNENLFNPEAYMKAEFNFNSPYPPDHVMFSYFDGISEMAKDLMKRMINVNPSARPSASDILRHPWFEAFGGYSKPTMANTVFQYANDIESTMTFEEIQCC